MKKYTPDYRWEVRSQDVIAQGSLTNSKRLQCLVKGIYPSHLSKSKGCFVWDTQNVKFIDYICALGTNYLGYGNPDIQAAVLNQFQYGVSFSLASTKEVEFGEKFKEVYPEYDRIKIFKTGSEACSNALKVARAYTGRKKVLSDGYHGNADEFISLSEPGFGCVQKDHIQKLTNLSEIDQSIAAVIVEPVILDYSSERRKYLNDLREVCTKHGVVLIFDEVITALRFERNSVSKAFGIVPDLWVGGKAIGNGFPICVLAGKKDLMNCCEYFASGTFYGEALSLAAGLQVLTLMLSKFSTDILWKRGELFKTRFNQIGQGVIELEGYPTRGRFNASDLVKGLFFQEMCKAKIIIGPSWFYNFDLMEVDDLFFHVMKDIVSQIKNGTAKMEGEPPQSPFAQKMREAK